MAAVAALGTGSVCVSAPARAHVHAASPGAVRGSTATVTFDVPNESETGSATTELTVTLPHVTAVRTESKAGWTARLGRDAAAGTVRSVTWTAAAGAGIGADQFGLFRVAMKLPDVDTVRFPASQRYADGTVVHWDQPPLPDGGEPEHPAATLTLAAGPAAPANRVIGSADNSARLLAGVALLVAALATAVAIARRRE
ncbi:MAG TPA: YcnI family protein [Mycobacterium sp.]|nr:YcnI family protein [Mycobacterium sp.]